MTRTFACLAAALALLSFSGCGDPPNGSVAQAANSDALRPEAPAPEDRNVKSTPLPLAPSALPAVASPTAAQQPLGQAPNAQPPTDSSAQAAPQAAPPPSDGGGLLQGIFSGASTPNTPGGSPSADSTINAGQITLSDLSVRRLHKGQVHFEVSYVFTIGQPNPSLTYIVHLSGKNPMDPSGVMWGENTMAIAGKDVAQHGKFEGELDLNTTDFDYKSVVTAVPSTVTDKSALKADSGSMVSNTAEFHTGGYKASGNVQNNAPPTTPSTAPATGGGGLLQGLFGNTPDAKTPTQTPPTQTPNAPSNPATDGEIHINMAGPMAATVDERTIHVAIPYVVIQGKPDPAKWYTVVVQNMGAHEGDTHEGELKIAGKDIEQRGKLEGDVTMTGRKSALRVQIWEGPSREDRGHAISVVLSLLGGGNLPRGNNGPSKPAVAGVGAQGRDYGAGMVTTPISTYFAAKQLIVFNVQIPNAMKFFNASNNRNPNSQDEFMEKIIKDNGITLPDLPAGERYVYDPQAGELMVEHPKK